MKLLGGLVFTHLTLLSLLGNVRGEDQVDSGKPTLLLQGTGPQELALHGMGNVYAPDVHFENGVFRMWYDGRKDLPLDAPAENVPKSAMSRRSVGYATSTDGLHWSKQSDNPVFADDAGGLHVTRVGSRYVLVYESRSGTRMTISDDGVDWGKGELLLDASGGDLDRFGHVTPSLLVPPESAAAMLHFGAASATAWNRNSIALVRIPTTELQRRINSLADKEVDRKLARGSAWAAGLKPDQVADRVAVEFTRREEIRGGYANDLTLEAMLAMYDATGERKYLDFVSRVLSGRLPPSGFPSYRSQPFNCITISLFERTGEQQLIEPYIAEMNKYRQNTPRSFDGAVSHYGDPEMGRILIDQLQDYSARMARAGWLSGDESFYREAVDPYYHLDRLAMPKFIVNASGDQFFCPDSSQFYFHDLHGEKHLRYVPNVDHSLRDSDALESIAAFYQMVVAGKPRARFSWVFEGDGSIRVTADDKPNEVRLWQATNPKARDFRLKTIGAAFTSSILKDQGEGVFVGRIDPPNEGWTAFFVELRYDTGTSLPLKLTTAVRVSPNTLPHSGIDVSKTPYERELKESR